MTKKEIMELDRINRTNKLNLLYGECLDELKSINIDFSNSRYGDIDISLAKRKTKRYGCCKNENPIKSTAYREHRRTYYRAFATHHIEVSSWLMDLNDDIIKNTIVHELIHCLPDCNNHGTEFKKYAKYINSKLGYNITRVGNKKEDFEKSNLDYTEDEKEENSFKYKIECTSCGYTFYRKRLQRGFARKYLCGKCRGRFRVENL